MKTDAIKTAKPIIKRTSKFITAENPRLKGIIRRSNLSYTQYINMRKKFIYIYILLIALTACSSRGCVESEFHLAKDSRLPVWFHIPDGMNRQDLDVVLTYYTTGPADITLLDIRGGNSKSLVTIKGINNHHPEYWAWAQQDWPKRSYPAFVVINVNGVSEIIEHKKMEPLFYASNEAAVQRVIAGNNTYN